MDLTNHASETRKRASSGPLAQAISGAEDIFETDGVVPGIGLKEAGVGAMFVLGLASIGAAVRFGVPANEVLGQSVSTENALTTFNAIAGIGGFIGTFIASSRLSSVPGDGVALGSIALPIAFTTIGNVIAGVMFPSG